MRRPFVAGNWKMFKSVAEARVLMAELLPGLTSIQGVEIVLCPPFTSILPVSAMLEGTDIGVGAQNMHWEESGAYTGEVSSAMVAEFCKYVIIGHSERRAHFGETDQGVNRKVKAALAHGLVPIICVGETLEENEAGFTRAVVARQVQEGLDDVDSASISSVVIAYEPVWAIGTGRAATAEGANQVIADIIRRVLHQMVGESSAQDVRVLYGGSVKASNAEEFFRQADIDGALVGGASLRASEFIPVVKAAAG
ncbi:MAG: triose-phosphate isomerase [Chloroflexi bacterium RBG_13_48_10]|jgi:triosephosphate isomerase|nr:MAG: triose-phosphate isomerase [Chloroflexi bacterium RBG_13_48_10]